MDARLREAIETGHTIVTANARQARFVRLDLAHAQAGRGASAWSPPPILAWHAWLARLHEELRWTASGSAHTLLNHAQEQRVWEQLIEEDAGSALLASPGTARQARAAWGLMQAWRLPDLGHSPFASEEVQAFARWLRAYQERCRAEGWLDQARQPDALRVAISAAVITAPRGVMFFGFDQLTPQQRALIQALSEHGTQAIFSPGPQQRAQASRLEFASPEQELATVAHWSRLQLAAGEPRRIGIVVPQLAARRDLVQRILDEALVPGATLPGRAALPRPYHLGAAPALADHAIVRAARAVLALLAGRIALADLSRVLRSPFIADASARAPERALCDAWLRREGAHELDFEQLPRYLAAFTESRRGRGDVALHGPFERARMELPRRGARCPADVWATVMGRCLQAFGWPGERTLNASEQAAVSGFQDVLVSFASTELVQGAIDAREALSQLAGLLGREPLRAEQPEAPVQVLDVMDAGGLSFDELWISGMNDDAWPPPADPNPFVPMEWQRRFQLPGGTPEAELERAQRLTQCLLCAADRVVVSHAARDGDRSLGPSPLVRAIERDEVSPFLWVGLADSRRALQGAAELESLHDERAPPLAPPERTRGGTRVLKLQAACPFRAYGELRLHAAGLATVAPLFDARLRGTLLHAALERLWRELGSLRALQALDDAAVERLLAAVAEDALAALELDHLDSLRPRRRGVEVMRLVRTLRDWLAVERERAAFSIHALETARTVKLAGMELGTRADRIDRLEDDALVIIDYKGGAAERRAPACWLGERPDEPQVPLYALAEPGPLAGAFIAHVRPARPAFSGAARAPGIVPDVDGQGGESGTPRFAELRAHWRASLERLAEAYAGGDARVDPKQPGQTCRGCELGLLCRIAELNAASAEAADG